MKLLRYGPQGQERPAMLDDGGVPRDLSRFIPDITPDVLAPEMLARLSELPVDDLPPVTGGFRIGACLTGFQKFIGIGLNYADHARESGQAEPTEPILFTKHLTCLSGPYDDVILPKHAVKGDWEAELGVVIGRTAKNLPRACALDHVAGYCVVNDISERESQLERGGQWVKGKSYDTFGPIGPWLVTADEIEDPQKLSVWLELNGETMQDGSTAEMIFPVDEIVSYVSRYLTLLPGDLISTGTPAGVGMGKKPQRFLRAGDVMRLGVERLGEQRQTVRYEA